MNIAIALVPVVAFLIALSLMDSFRLVRPASTLSAIAYGAVSAAAILWLHNWLLHVHHVPAGFLTRYIAPVTEETAKALLIGVLISSARVGFLVDAAVQGFAVGTGFALVENLTYLRSMPDAVVTLWIVRGLGHGGPAGSDDSDLRDAFEDARGSSTRSDRVRLRAGLDRRGCDSFAVQPSVPAGGRADAGAPDRAAAARALGIRAQ